mmetsp:Transcript_54190/g.158216  ORF Transcript_54190/g.158216 Transcript_54190/m.158216 type:complete len:284 (+) Transcript_54190:2037-2888(+)
MPGGREAECQRREGRPEDDRPLEAEVEEHAHAPAVVQGACKGEAQRVEAMPFLIVPDLGHGPVRKGLLKDLLVDHRPQRELHQIPEHQEQQEAQHRVGRAPEVPGPRAARAVLKVKAVLAALAAGLVALRALAACRDLAHDAHARLPDRDARRHVGGMQAVVLRNAFPMAELVRVEAHEGARGGAHRGAALGRGEALGAARAPRLHGLGAFLVHAHAAQAAGQAAPAFGPDLALELGHGPEEQRQGRPRHLSQHCLRPVAAHRRVPLACRQIWRQRRHSGAGP